jgi:hypothetical protein
METDSEGENCDLMLAHPTTVCMTTLSTVQYSMREREQKAAFDAESFELLIDNCASMSITNKLKDFSNQPIQSTTKIVGINGTTQATSIGTVKWNIEDDADRVHELILPNTYYSPGARSRLLSPQHWAQQAEE